MTEALRDRGDDAEDVVPTDPREVLAAWANNQDEWVRRVVRQALESGRGLSEADLNGVYALFRQEKGLDERTLPVEPALAVDHAEEAAELPLVITKLADVAGVNAITTGSIIEPHAGMTILFGENGTGKTGYSRIFKALAGSRTASPVLGNVALEEEIAQAATVEYTVGPDTRTLAWSGEQGVAPFTRMSIFDTPAVNFHVDDELEYVYVPTVLSIFNHVNAAVKGIHDRVDAAIRELATGATTLLSRFPRESSLYPIVEALGAATDLPMLDARADRTPDVDQRIEALRRAVAALEADTLSAQISGRQRVERVLRQITSAAKVLEALDVEAFNSLIKRIAELHQDYRAFRDELFAAAELPAHPEETWDAFVASGDVYRSHLEANGVHDSDRCLYCRQQLSDPAKALVAKYSEYLTDKISSDIAMAERARDSLTGPLLALKMPDVAGFLDEHEAQEQKPPNYENVATIQRLVTSSVAAIHASNTIDDSLPSVVPSMGVALDVALQSTVADIADLRMQSENRLDALKEKKRELAEQVAAGELGKSWASIQAQVERAKEADRLRTLGARFTALGRAVTELAKAASDQLVNQNFELLFAEECKALRAPDLRVEFVGRQGRAHRRKTLGGRHKPSKVLSEGEQKVLALADFLAEARIAGITAPVIFDDPVSSLDHRRIDEVARRIASLADDNQVIVFTHDVFFATTLLSLFEASKRCTYFQITDDDGKGNVTRASGPRWDSLSNLRTNINKTLDAARAVDGEARAALVREGYDWIRAWCEVFTETELLAGVSQRYQPNIRMTTLGNIKAGVLPATSEVVTRIFEVACRYIPGHSQPLPTLGVAPTLAGLEAHWQELQDARRAYLAADG